MENLQFMVDEVVNFFNKTLPIANSAGPFSTKDLEVMFAEAHFCTDLLQLPSEYGSVVEQLQEKYNLLLAPQILLQNLADNLRVNQQSMNKARSLFDKQGTDLNSWLFVQQRHSLRSQFLDFSQRMKNEDQSSYEKLKDYLFLVESSKKSQVNFVKLIKEKPEKCFRLLLLECHEFESLQRNLMKNVVQSFTRSDLFEIYKSLIARIIVEKPEFRTLALKLLSQCLHTSDNVEESIEILSDLLFEALQNCDLETSSDILQKFENLIETPFYKDELRNRLVVKISQNKYRL